MTMDEKKKMLAVGFYKNYRNVIEPHQIYIDPFTEYAYFVKQCSEQIFYYIPLMGWFAHDVEFEHKGSLTKNIPEKYTSIKEYLRIHFTETFKRYFFKKEVHIVDIGSKYFLLSYIKRNENLYFALLSYSYAKKTLIVHNSFEF